jgi:hypothetical protein
MGGRDRAPHAPNARSGPAKPERSIDEMGGRDRAPHPPQRSERPGEAGPLD